MTKKVKAFVERHGKANSKEGISFASFTRQISDHIELQTAGKSGQEIFQIFSFVIRISYNAKYH
jgi:hypothetical protein